jgi:hypothetical protein
MAFAPFNIALQVIAAFVIFIFGYVALFVSLIICLAVCFAIGKGIYEGARRVRAYAVRSAPAKASISNAGQGKHRRFASGHDSLPHAV